MMWYGYTIRQKLEETCGVNLFSLLSTVLKHKIKILDSNFIIYISVRGPRLRARLQSQTLQCDSWKLASYPSLHLIISRRKQYLFHCCMYLERFEYNDDSPVLSLQLAILTSFVSLEWLSQSCAGFSVLLMVNPYSMLPPWTIKCR